MARCISPSCDRTVVRPTREAQALRIVSVLGPCTLKYEHDTVVYLCLNHNADLVVHTGLILLRFRDEARNAEQVFGLHQLALNIGNSPLVNRIGGHC